MSSFVYLFITREFSGKRSDASNIKVQFTPILRAYITSDYRHTKILQKAIDAPAIWEQNLAALSESTTWTLKRDPYTGHYQIT
jgi:hypothetical protein